MICESCYSFCTDIYIILYSKLFFIQNLYEKGKKNQFLNCFRVLHFSLIFFLIQNRLRPDIYLFGKEFE